MNRLHSILFMGSSFGAMSSRWYLPMMFLSTRPAAAFTVNPTTIAHRSRIQQRTIRSALCSPTTVLLASSSNEDEKVVPTWEYVPYDAKTKRQPSTRNKSNNNRNRSFVWTVPKEIKIPEDCLEMSFVRSSGSGGQNVNKLSTKVELRLDLNTRQAWMPAEVQRRLREQQNNRISKENVLSVTAQEHRTQGMNRKSALDKLRRMVLQAWPRPKIRKQRKGISKAAKARNKESKKRQSEKKQSRGKVDW